MNKVASDYLGREIKVGCTVVYPVRRGAAMWLKKSKVSQIVEIGEEFNLVVYDPEAAVQRGHRVKNLHTCVVVGQPGEEV